MVDASKNRTSSDFLSTFIVNGFDILVKDCVSRGSNTRVQLFDAYYFE